MPRRFAIGDIHGAAKALVQVLEAANFDKENDHLYVLGDVFDGWPDVYETIMELNTIKNRITIIGNHDVMSAIVLSDIYEDRLRSSGYMLNPIIENIVEKYKYMDVSYIKSIWLNHGGTSTLESLDSLDKVITALNYISTAYHAYETEFNELLVHGSYDIDLPKHGQDINSMIWERKIVEDVVLNDREIEEYKAIYVGHTTTLSLKGMVDDSIDITKPIIKGALHMMDTGAAFEGRLSMVDMDSKDIIQSAPVYTLYKGHKGRLK